MSHNRLHLVFNNKESRDIVQSYLLGRNHTLISAYTQLGLTKGAIQYHLITQPNPNSPLPIHPSSTDVKEVQRKRTVYRNQIATTQLQSVKETYAKLLKEMWVNI